MKQPREPKGGDSEKKINQPSLPGISCALCNYPHSRKSREFRDLPICDYCYRRILGFRRLTQRQANDKARRLIASVICMTFARRGYNAGLDVAATLGSLLEP